MRLFSTRKAQTVQKHRAGKKVVIMAGMMMALFMAAPLANNNVIDKMTGTIEAQAAEQTPNWFQEGSTWKVKDNNGNIITNSWFCDLDGSWYLMDENGNMREGIINDNGHYYSLETSHEGHYGRMRTVNGSYDGVYLSFNQEHNGTYGEILTGTTELINLGIKVTTVNGLPANSVYAKDFLNSKTKNEKVQEQQSNNEKNKETTIGKENSNGVLDLSGLGGGYTPHTGNFFVG